MKKCMEIDKPLVTVAMAIYQPNETWLIEQLKSLNNQTYSNIELIIWNDSPDFPVDEKLFKTYITNFKYQIYIGEKNLGSNGAFEKLTEIANGKYISYCDQDDVWNNNKIELMVTRLEKTNSSLVCSDLYIIDKDGNKIGDSIAEIRKRHIFREGKGLAKYLLISNFVTGCAMMMKTEIAKKAIPFEETLVHDQWLAIIAALNGNIEVIYETTIGYRQHENNQTGILTGVMDKTSYYNIRLESLSKRVNSFCQRLCDYDELTLPLSQLCEWVDARKRYFHKPNISDLKVMNKYKNFGAYPILIERMLPFIPNFIFKRIVKLAQKGIL